MKVRKAVIVAAGLGTRMLPASKVIPKEMLPVVDKPAIQVVVEEAIASGIEEIILVLSPGRTTVREHFRRAEELERHLEQRGKTDLLDSIRTTNDPVRFTVAFQKEPLGLGHAVLQAHEAVGNEPFAAMLPDDIFDAARPCLRQLLDVAENKDAPTVALLRVPRSEIPKYGIVSVRASGDKVYELTGMVESGDRKSPERLRDTGTICSDAGHFRDAGEGKAGSRRRNPANGRTTGTMPATKALRLRIRRHTLRSGRPPGLPDGANRLRLETPGTG